jgi:hypothetical protein
MFALMGGVTILQKTLMREIAWQAYTLEVQRAVFLQR